MYQNQNPFISPVPVTTSIGVGSPASGSMMSSVPSMMSSAPMMSPLAGAMMSAPPQSSLNMAPNTYFSPPPGKAPPPYGSAMFSPNPTAEVKIFSTNQEREYFDNLADLYSIIKTTELLERAYIRDSVQADEYTPVCAKLIAQYKAAQNLLPGINVKQFMVDYRVDTRAAEKRLIEIGVPATIEFGSFGRPPPDPAVDPNVNISKIIAETVQHFITSMDSLKLKMVAVDQVQPLVHDLLESLNKIPSLPPDWEGKVKFRNWLTILNKMKASDELTEEQARQMLFDLESSYNAFHRSL